MRRDRRVVIVGGSGFIGKNLKEYLSSYEVLIVSRNPKKGITYDEVEKYLDENTVLINLAGKNVFGYWTKSFKRKILDSRVNVGRILVEKLKRKKVSLFVQASAIGYYGRSRDEEFDEFSRPENPDLLTKVVEEWENSTKEVEDLGMRRVVARIGVVLGKDSKTLKLMSLPFKFFLGGVVGDGHQPMSWIHVKDLCRAFEHFIQGDSHGVYNLVSPNPTTNLEMTKALSEILRRPAFVRVPGFALKLFLGEVAEYLILEGQRVVPRRLIAENFEFQFSDIRSALKDILQP